MFIARIPAYASRSSGATSRSYGSAALLKAQAIHLCRLRSYVVLVEQVVWNEALAGSGLCISFHPEPTGRRYCSLVRQV
jgi:hypothetical protein